MRESMSSSQPQKQRLHSTHVMEITRSGRPFVMDLHNMFCTLIVSLPMETHRNSSGMYANSFTAGEAIASLRSLKLVRSHREPDKENPSKIVTTTTITRFNMSKDTAKVACQTFLDARLFGNLSDPSSRLFKDKSIYGITSKGISILERFLSINDVNSSHLTKIFLSQSKKLKVFTVGRGHDTDSISLSKQNIDSIFRRFAGSKPNVLDENYLTVNYSRNNYFPGIELKDYHSNDKKYRYTFSGMAACDWLCSFTTLISKDEAKKVLNEFIRRGFIKPVDVDDNHKDNNIKMKLFKQKRHPRNSKSIYYHILDKGRKIALWQHGHLSLISTLSENESILSQTNNGIRVSLNGNIQNIQNIQNNNNTKESNIKKLQQILDDPKLCALFMNFSKTILCEENLSFLLQVQKFKKKYNTSINEVGEFKNQKEKEDLIVDAFKIYNTYLAPASPNELNIDFNLRQSMIQYMTSIASKNDEGPHVSISNQSEPITCCLYDRIQDVIYNLTAIDSVPKFIRTKEYLTYIQRNESVEQQ